MGFVSACDKGHAKKEITGWVASLLSIVNLNSIHESVFKSISGLTNVFLSVVYQKYLTGN